MLSDVTTFVLDIIGTVSFAISGSLVSIRAKLDLFGTVFLGFVTAFFGGIMRDIIIGVGIPYVFSKFYLVMVSVITSVIVFIICYIKRKKFNELEEKISYINNFFDAIGLGAFTVMGVEIAFAGDLSSNMFVAVTLGFLTAVGGGVVRDVLANTAPYILTKHIYALVSILGASIYYVMRVYQISVTYSSAFVIAFVFVVRMIATKYRWKLPKINFEEKGEDIDNLL